MAGPTLDLGNLLIHLKADITQYTRMMRTVENQMRSTSRKLTQIGTQMSLRVTAPIVAMGTASVKAFANFDDAMTKSLAIMSNITPQIRGEMESLALTISEQGVTSAKELARSYFFLASAGLDAKQSMAALGAVNAFAIAGAFDMATATDLATDAQSALGLTVKDAQQNLVNMTRVTDVLVGANTLANASTEQFALSLTSQAGPAMKAYGIQLEEGVAVLAAFADQGIKAQNAGNLFSRMLRLMTKGFLDNRTAWKRFNINIFDAVGNLKPMATIVGDISVAMENMSTKQKVATLQMLGFQARSQQAILPLLGMQNAIAEYTKELKDMGGITKRVADEQLKSFSSQMKILRNQIVNVGIDIGNILAPMILSLNEKIKVLIQGWKELDDATKRVIVSASLFIAAIGPALIILGSLIKIFLLLKGAALVAASSILAIPLAILAIKNAPQIGQHFHDEFKLVQQLAANFLLNIEAVWIRIGFGFKQMLAGMQVAWDATINTMKRTLAALLDGFSNLPGAGGLDDVVNKLRASTSTAGRDQLEKNRKEFEKQLEIFRDKSNTIFLDVERNFAEKENNKVQAAEEAISKIQELIKSLQDQGPEEGGKGFLGFDIETFNDRVQEWVDSATNLGNNIADAFTSGLDRLSQGISDLLFKGEADFRAIVASIAQEITTQIIKSAIASAVQPLLGGLGIGGGQEVVAATMNQEAALVNQAAAGINQSAAFTGQASAFENQASSFTNQAAAFEMVGAAGTNAAAGGTMVTASAAMIKAAATMLTAAGINAGATAGGVAHAGGMIGNISAKRMVPSSTFVGASRLHNGLADDEFAMIAERGEVVLTKDNVAEMKDSAGKGSNDRGGTTINNFHIEAVDAKGVAKFFKTHRRQIALAVQATGRENNPIRRRGS